MAPPRPPHRQHRRTTTTVNRQGRRHQTRELLLHSRNGRRFRNPLIRPPQCLNHGSFSLVVISFFIANPPSARGHHPHPLREFIFASPQKPRILATTLPRVPLCHPQPDYHVKPKSTRSFLPRRIIHLHRASPPLTQARHNHLHLLIQTPWTSCLILEPAQKPDLQRRTQQSQIAHRAILHQRRHSSPQRRKRERRGKPFPEF
ncbi:hypothetical protein LR48_Vigan08g053600 [Vigna angularis]|uniref:Uncharacterized protein n=1 Tax=Phaseolus angularis TaxID=3914 RepID=A0A0L9V4Q2_PHAAN|nr:hypothetical protein LR48_Vigan08g053600 [Vigna angularis]